MLIKRANRLNVAAVRIKNETIQNGYAIETGTNKRAVARISNPRMADLVAAAPT